MTERLELQPLLFSIAYRMLGSVAEAEDVVQEALLRHERVRQQGTPIGSSKGAWLIGRTVTVKVWVTVLTPPLAVPPLSVTVTVIVAVPFALANGVKVSVPVAPGLA